MSEGKEPLPNINLMFWDCPSSETDTLPDIEPDDDLNYSEDSISNFKKVYEWVNFSKLNSSFVKCVYPFISHVYTQKVCTQKPYILICILGVCPNWNGKIYPKYLNKIEGKSNETPGKGFVLLDYDIFMTLDQIIDKAAEELVKNPEYMKYSKAPLTQADVHAAVKLGTSTRKLWQVSYWHVSSQHYQPLFNSTSESWQCTWILCSPAYYSSRV